MSDPIDLSAWRIRQPFLYDLQDGRGTVLFSPGERVPATMTPEDLVKFETMGVLVQPDADGNFPQPKLPHPDTPRDYLNHSDMQIMALLRQYPLVVTEMDELRTLARQQGRSELMLAVLDLITPGTTVADPGPAIERAKAEALAERDQALRDLQELSTEITTLRVEAEELRLKDQEAQARIQALEAQVATLTPPASQPRRRQTGTTSE